ncbi:sensor histidine kinase [Zoogloea sp. LCSB751]|uniref:sensor histidine kinase n=1 Tax=Zoogloea sp. LCSB751 TaxID=1965277 RepID=UPI0009A4C33C|nr:sensor histidine kinase [Zoogloea sp. LCSB751]
MPRLGEARALRNRLLMVISWPLLILLAASMVADYRAALSIADEAYDNALTGTVVALVTRLERDDDDKDIEVDIPPAADEILRSDALDKVQYVVFDNREKVIAGDAELLQLPRPEVANRSILQDATVGKRAVRTASYRYESPRMTATVIVAETTLKRRRAANRILATIFWPNLLLIAAALLLVYFGVRYALKPLDVLGRHIAARGPSDFSPIEETGVPAEAGPLVRAINRLLQHLGRAGRAQQAFLSNAAHQLRTPLAGLQTQLELAVEVLPAEARPRIERLRESTGRLVHFTNQMLALARSSSEGALISDYRPVDLAALLEDAASDLLDDALAKHIDLGFETAPAWVLGSRWMLREVLANLIDNAIAYTPAGGRVTVRCGHREEEGVFVEVEDDGPGIPESERSRVFERFYRGGSEGVPGTGLGLAIVKEVADRHAAEVLINSGSQGTGTCVRVVFPQAPAATPPTA